MEYTITLNSNADYRVLKKILKAFDGATIKPSKKRSAYTIEDSMREVRSGDIVGPFTSVEDFMKDLLD